MSVIAWAGLVVILVLGHGWATNSGEQGTAPVATAEQQVTETTGGADSATGANSRTGVIRAGLPKMICTREKIMGSIRPRTICRTRTEVEAARKEADYYIRARDNEGIPQPDERSFER